MQQVSSTALEQSTSTPWYAVATGRSNRALLLLLLLLLLPAVSLQAHSPSYVRAFRLTCELSTCTSSVAAGVVSALSTLPASPAAGPRCCRKNVSRLEVLLSEPHKPCCRIIKCTGGSGPRCSSCCAMFLLF